MQTDWTLRTQMLIGAEGLRRLSASSVCVVGLGGVGAYAAEMLARAGVGTLLLIDSDSVSQTNINRQLIALHSTVGRPKTEVLAERLKDINPDVNVLTVSAFVNEDNIDSILGQWASRGISYVVDAIDTLSPKIALVQFCLRHNIPLVSSMGSGAKMDATAVRLADISKTYECPLARMLRKRLHKLGIHKGFKAVFSPEFPDKTGMVIEQTANKKSQVGTISYMPAVFGCVCAQAVIADLTEDSYEVQTGEPV